MENNEVNLRAVDTILDKPTTFTVPIHNSLPSTSKRQYGFWDRLLIFLGVKKEVPPEPEATEREFTVRATWVGTMLRIGKRAQNIPDTILESSLSKLVVEGSALYMDDFIYIVACGIQNNREEPTEELMDFIRWNFTMEDIFTACDIILSKFNFKAFINTTVLVRGADVLNVQEQDVLNVAEQVS